MNGLSAVLDQITANPYVSHSSGANNSHTSAVESCRQQLAYEEFIATDKALVVNGRALVDTTDSLFNTAVFGGDHCLDTNQYFGSDCGSLVTTAAADQQLPLSSSITSWTQFSGDLLLTANDLNQFGGDFGHNFDANIAANSCPQKTTTDSDPNCLKRTTSGSHKKSAPKPKTKKECPSQSSTGTGGAGRPAKPVSAYALFFRDAQSVIKAANPTASFGDISKVVASNWESLNRSQKQVYKERADAEKKNYLKTLASSRAQQIAGLLADAKVSSSLAAIAKTSSLLLPSMAVNQSVADLMDNRVANETNSQNNEAMNVFESSAGAPPMTGNDQQFGANAGESYGDGSGGGVGEQLQQNLVSTSDPQPGNAVPKQHCIRGGCANDAIDSQEWDSEYCSSECCVKHCADVFQAWVQRQQQFPEN